MKKESTVAYILRLSLVLFLITAVIAGLLAGVNAITKDRIAEANAKKTKAAISLVLSGVENPEALAEFPNESGMVSAVYKSDIGYAVQVAPNGFGGPISMMVGVDFDGSILGISIINQTETAGLGAVSAAKTSAGQKFRDQFAGLSGELAVGADVDALTGATITSKAVTEGVNAALRCVENLNKEAA